MPPFIVGVIFLDKISFDSRKTNFYHTGSHALTSQELLKTECDVAIMVFIEFLENVCHALQDDAASDQNVEVHFPFTATVKARIQVTDEIFGDSVSKSSEGLDVFLKADSTRLVPIKTLE